MKTAIQSFLVFIVILFYSIAAQTKTASEIFEEVSPSIVVVIAQNASDKSQSLGSGVMLENGLVATNCHVIKGANVIQVIHQDVRYSTFLKGADWNRDVCTLSVAGLKGHSVSLGSTRQLRVGEKVYAIGAPRGLELSFSDGLISSLRHVPGGEYLQITAPISPGSSGGGLFDDEGRLIGLPTFYYTQSQQLNFAVPVEWIKDLLNRQVSNPQKQEENLIGWLNRAIELEGEKDWAGMVDHVLRWVKAQPENSIAWFELGIAYNDSGKKAKAIEAYQQAIRIKPDYADAWDNLCVTYDDTAQFDKAIRASEQSLRINPQNSFAWVNLGVVYNHLHQTEKAFEAYQQSIRIDPENAVAWNNVGLVYLNSNQPTEAINSFQQAVRFNSEYANAWVNLGNAYGNSGQTEKQFEAYQQAIRSNPADSTAWKNIGMIYLASKKFEKAIQAYQQAIRFNPNYANAWYDLGIAYKYSGQNNLVIDVYNHLKILDSPLSNKFYNNVVLLK
jgi:tetratricopeptide (TPR) repeat protein